MGNRKAPKRGTRMLIKSVKPTVLFARDGKELRHVVDLTIDNPGVETNAELLVRFGSQEERLPIKSLPQGKSVQAVHFPDIRKPTTVSLTLLANGDVEDKQDVAWKPQRHWHVYMTQSSHHDWGYTDLPSHVLDNHAEFMDQILDFCDETDDFPEDAKYRYTVEQSWSLLHFLRNRGEESIRRCVERMREGRIEVTALFGNQTSEMCSHEELVRLLYPSFELRRKYGIPIQAAEINDVPGVCWGLASVLADAGVKYFAFGMPRWYFGSPENGVAPPFDEAVVLPNGRPDAHWWEGPDGGKVLIWHGQPGTDGDNHEAEVGFAERLARLDKRGYPFDAVYVRLCGGCTDNAPPTVRFSYVAREWNARWAYPRLIVGTLGGFFDHIAKQCGEGTRSFRGDIPQTDYAVGATSTERETAINRLTHDELGTAERFAAVASEVAGYKYPAKQIRKAYENMLLYDEHTWGMCDPGGVSQDAARWEKGSLALHAATLAHDVRIKSTNIIADQVALTQPGPHVVVFNSLGVPRTDVVTVPLHDFRPCRAEMFWHYHDDASKPPSNISGAAIGRNLNDLPGDLDTDTYDLIDIETGNPVPFQVDEVSRPQAPVPFAADRYSLGQTNRRILNDLVFVAQDVPAMGYRTYRLVPRKRKKTTKTSIKVGNTTLENRFFKVRLDPKTGSVASIYDKGLKRELVDAKADHQFNQLVVRTSADSKTHAPKTSAISKGRTGPVCCSLIVTGDGLGCPQRTQEIILYDSIKRIDCANRILKDSTPQQEVYFAFPFKLDKPRFQFEASDAVIEPIKDQFPGSCTHTYTAQHYVDVSDDKGGVTWSSREGHIVSLGGFWPLHVSSAHHNVTPPNFGRPFLKEGDPVKGHIYSCAVTSNYRTNFAASQTGDMLFRYSFTAHEGDRVAGGARDFGWAICSPLVAACVNGKRKGPLPASNSFISVEPANVLLTALKRAEDGKGLIVRLLETDGVATKATVRLPFLDVAQAYVTNVVEENQTILRCGADAVTAPIDAWGITTIRILPR